MTAIAAANTVDKSAETFRDKILRKCGESVEMKEKFFEKYADGIEELSQEMAKRFADGHKLLTMGNGGSLCDALHFAVEFTHPIIEKRAAFSAIPLMTDVAMMTAVSNDTDYARVFVDQLRLLGQPGDIALAVSTSGKSPGHSDCAGAVRLAPGIVKPLLKRSLIIRSSDSFSSKRRVARRES